MALRDSRFEGYKFRRQAVIGMRIVDFFCPAKCLVIEIDGDTHDRELDLRRDAMMKRDFGFEVLRFTNDEVVRNLECVLTVLKMRLPRLNDRWPGYERRLLALSPSSSEEGVGGGGAATGGALSRTVAKALRDATQRLAATSDTARLDAEVLMAHALGVSRSELLLRHTGDSTPEEFASLVDRRARHEPVAYITGTQEFFGLPFTVTKDVLIPRGDSEVLVESALSARPDARRVLDCGTGSGALLLAVLAGLPEAEGIGIDVSPAALEVAQTNARQLGIGRAQFAECNWHDCGWSQKLGLFDLILANPPYVEAQAELAPSVRNHEPALALFAGPEGLDDYRVLVPQLPGLLAPGGLAFVEIGANQAEAVTAIATAAGLTARLHKDLAERPRVLELALGR